MAVPRMLISKPDHQFLRSCSTKGPSSGKWPALLTRMSGVPKALKTAAMAGSSVMSAA